MAMVDGNGRVGSWSRATSTQVDSQRTASYIQDVTVIEHIRVPTAAVFRSQYYTPEQPVVLTGAIEDWPARQRWSFDYLGTKLGETAVNVQWRQDDYASTSGQSWIAHTKLLEMPFSELVAQIRAGNSSYYLAQTPLAEISAELAQDVGEIPFYPRLLGKLSRLPCTVWIGPAGTNAPLHYDPHHNLFVQLVGRKRFLLYPSSQLGDLYLPSTLPNQSNFSPVDVQNPDLERFPRFAAATCMEVIVGPGEVLFLPRNWGHSVFALDDAISLTNWWQAWPTLLREYQQILGRRTRRAVRKGWAVVRRKPRA